MAEAELNVLKKLESNKSCVNCDAYNKFGHGNVCEKFKTFVCSNCKSAHQSYSMRVKSVTMSNWTKDEVDALKEENGGGNAAAKRVWLGHWDESCLRKPKDGDHVDVYKRFIDKVYNDRAFYDEDAAANPAASSSSSSSSSKRSGGGGSSRNVNGNASNGSANGYAAPAAANLLDFNSPTASSSSSASVPTFDAFASPPKSSGGDGWGAFASAAPANDGFGAFTSAPVAAPTRASFDPFGSSTAAPVAAASTPSFDPFGPSTASSSAPASTPSFDPFGASSFGQPQPQQQAFGGFGGAAPQQPRPMAPAANFSAFDALSGPPQSMGMGMGMGMGGGVPRGPHMGMGMGMGMAPPQGMMMGGGMPRPMMNGGGYMGAPAPQQMPAYGGQHGGMHGGSRDPFAGLGLPGK